MKRCFIAFTIIATLTMTSCVSGYRFENGSWSWVDFNGTRGRKVTKINPEYNESFKVLKYRKYATAKNTVFFYGSKIDNADSESFKVLTKSGYAIDKNSVYIIGSKINNADPSTFKVLKKSGYSKDSEHVFLDTDIVLFADPNTFQTLDLLYSRDKNDVYCGTLPLKLVGNEVNEFRVTSIDDGYMKSSSLLSAFIKRNPDYAWLDTLNITGVIVGEGTGETKNRKFKGFREVKN